MDYRSGSQIREDFLRFFEGKQHRRVHSSSLVPQNDPTLLFTNAGMNQFKDVFLGAEKRDYTRATTSQKCVRAGGKHNDLENVGFTRRHHTFFEMLGNFSFGDYFKKDAIAYAWELLTSPEWFGIDPAKLYVTIFEGTPQVPRDDEAEQFWIATGVPKDRIFDMPAKDNFWQMGDTGPCGPCSEIFFDLGLAASETGEDKPFPQDDQRYVEIWNLVFMQFDRASDGTLTPLPKQSVDTGMGLERISAVLQGVISNYQTDLFTPLIAKAAELTGFNLTTEPGAPGLDSETWVSGAPQLQAAALSDAKGFASLRIIADHARAATFLISDGVQPANEGRGYVLRKILRRGIRHGRLLGQMEPFLNRMILAVVKEMSGAYPELIESAIRVQLTVLAEEQQFARVIGIGAQKLENYFAEARNDIQALSSDSNIVASFLKSYENESTRNTYRSRLYTFQSWFNELELPLINIGPKTLSEFAEHLSDNLGFNESSTNQYVGTVRILASYAGNFRAPTEMNTLAGDAAFRLYETYGLPLDYLQDAARDAGLEFDLAGFEWAKHLEQQRARASWKGGSQKSASPVYRELPKTEFEGYSTLRVEGAKVIALVKEGLGVSELKPGEEGEVVLDATSFYADSGGQVGDTGWLLAADHQSVVAEVKGCTKPVQGVFAHKVVAKQTIVVGDTLDTLVDGERRRAITRNHTGTHLLHAALREVLGKHVKQAGSLNDPARLRFDFSHFAGVAPEELAEVEDIVNRQVLANTAVQTFVDVPIDEAVNDLGAMALFGEKYGDRVRVVKIGDFSTELCGGIHTGATGEIGLLKLVGESSVASGVRRVEAISGTAALAEFRRGFAVAQIAGDAETLRTRLAATDEEIKKLRRELDQVKMKAASASTADAAGSAVEVKGVKVLAQRVDALDKGQLRSLVDSLRTQLGSGVVVLGAAAEGKVSLIVGVTKDLTGKVQAGKIVGILAGFVGGRGGGRPDLAEAGGSDVSGLDAAISKAGSVVGDLLG